MNTFKIQDLWLAVVAAGLALSPLTVAAQDSSAGTTPPLAYGVPQILKLAQAKVADDVILAYIHQTGNSYGLDADQIIYLRQQGISDKVLTAMLTRPRPASTPAPVAPPTVNPVPVQPQVAYAQPEPAYVQTVPSSSVYVMPNNQIYYSNWGYYPYYSYYGGCYPISYGWGGGYCGGGYYYRGGYGYHGGYCGGGYYNGYHGGNYCYAGGYRGGVVYANRGVNYHGGVTYASRGGSFHGGATFASRGVSSHGGGFARVGGSFHGGGGFGGGFHGGGMMRR